ncbi:MAG: adenylate/guanylate cyclase domain-containing protein [Mesorhizobium sp.]|jgi:adenylate cyclase
MPDERVQRRLAAIVACDVVSYSKMMGRDEAGTLARLKKLRSEFLHPKVSEYGGRVVKTTGDGTLIEFPSAVDAVSHAVDVQRGMAERNKDIPGDQQIRLRLGINVGDIIIDEDDIYGDGVNVAARLEALAEPDGICLSARVYDYVRDRLDVAYDDLGELAVKNIADLVHVYRVRLGEAASAGIPGVSQALPLPDKPSIAVLPFVNMSGDAEQEYFADGITEDLITLLSQIRWFFVIARNSSFAYKGKSPDIRAVARELGVAYVLEGSVRKAGNRVRVTAQLIDGASGNHVWAQRYDRDLEDIFAVQDEITATLVGAIEPELGKAERERARAKRPDDLRAWELYQRGLWHTYRRTREDLAEAQLLFRRAIAIDPGLARAYAAAEEAFFFQHVGGYVDGADAANTAALQYAETAVRIDGQDAFNRYALGRALTLLRRHDAAILELDKAIELEPSFAQAHYALGMALGTGGRPQEALPHIELAMRLSPQDPYFGQFLVRRAEAYLFLGRLEEAVESAERSLHEPNIQWSRWAILAAAQAHLGRLEDARRSIGALHALRPDIDLAFTRDYWPIADANALQYLVDGLRTAGLPGSA